MNSADHYAKELKISMSSLADILETIFETVFTVCFHKNSKKEITLKKFRKVK